MKIVMVTDIVSPFCWIAAKNLDRAMANFPELSFDLSLQPFKVTPNLPEKGITFQQYQQQHMSQTFGSMANVANILKQVQQFGHQAGCHFRFDRLVHWPNTSKAHGVLLMADKSKQWQLHKSLCQAHFELGLDLGDVAVLEHLGSQFGLAANDIRDKLTDQQYLNGVEQLITQPYSRGIHSVPHTLLNNVTEIIGAKDVATIAEAIKQTSAQLVTHAN